MRRKREVVEWGGARKVVLCSIWRAGDDGTWGAGVGRARGVSSRPDLESAEPDLSLLDHTAQ